LRPGVNELRLLYLGWLIRRKGLRDLINAVARVPTVRLDLVGPVVRPAEAAELRALIKSLAIGDRVTIAEPVAYHQVPRLMLGYDALILPSFTEAFGMVVVEAMSLGLPVIGTRTGILEHAPADAFVEVPIANPIGLGARLSSLADRRAVELPAVGERGRSFASEQFDEAATINAWRQMYAEIGRHSRKSALRLTSRAVGHRKPDDG
jgi:glycosyltransferase involved in cell wall biosynthesis